MGLYEEIYVENWINVRRVTQFYDRPKIDDVYTYTKEELLKHNATFSKGERVAVAVGSRYIANIELIVRATIEYLQSIGARPYVISAMGSHGGAAAEGQKELLDSINITPKAMGVPVIYDLEWTCIGQSKNDIPIYFSKLALSADAVVLINRVKRHTNFRGLVESGLVKMAVVGLGKHKGALTIHSKGFENFGSNMIEMYKEIEAKTPIRMGIAIVENAYDETAFIKMIPKKDILQTEEKLLTAANENVPRIPFNSIDLLVVREMGKDISGDGMDPNIIGRFSSSIVPDYNQTPHITRIATLNLTEKSHGSAVGVGYADIITKRLYEKISHIISYTNAITATAPGAVKIPPVMPGDREAMEAAFHTCPNTSMDNLRLCIIKNTLELEEMYVSEPVLSDVCEDARLEVDEKEYKLFFDDKGNLKIKSLGDNDYEKGN